MHVRLWKVHMWHGRCKDRIDRKCTFISINFLNWQKNGQLVGHSPHVEWLCLVREPVLLQSHDVRGSIHPLQLITRLPDMPNLPQLGLHRAAGPESIDIFRY
jgi:hypothetical protein